MKRTWLPKWSLWCLAAISTLSHSSATRLVGSGDVALAARALVLEQPATVEKNVAKTTDLTADLPPPMPVYRPYVKRYAVRPANKSRPEFNEPENRDGYRLYKLSHPRHPLTPNSNDRDAESTATLVCVVVAFALVVCSLFALDRLQHSSYEQLLSGMLLALSVPWLIATAWIAQVVLRHFRHPVRSGLPLGDGTDEWQCSALAWYLLLMPLVTAAAGTSQVLSMRQLPLAIPEETGKQAPMGRMFDSSFAHDHQATRNLAIRTLWLLVQSSVRYSLIGIAIAITIFGVLVVFFGGHGQECCQPEVWWTSVMLAASTLGGVVLVVCSALGCIAVVYITRSSWLQDFVGSFARPMVPVSGDYQLARAQQLGPNSSTSSPARI